MTSGDSSMKQATDNVLVVLDFDLTLFQSYDFTEHFYLYLQDVLGFDLVRLPKYERGRATDVLRQVEETFDHQFVIEDLVVELKRYILEAHGRAPQSFFFDDALRLLDYIKQHDTLVPLIMTKGGQGYQSLKLLFAEDAIHGIPYFIQDVSSHKAQEITAELFVNDHFEAAYPDGVVTASSLLFIDDKPKDLIGLPPHASGIFIPRKVDKVEEDMDIVNSAAASGYDVVTVATLDDVVTMLQNREK
jgi:hypothetical protein